MSVLRLSVIGLMLFTAAALGLLLFNVTRPASLPIQAIVDAPPPLQVSYIVAAHAMPAGTLARGEDFSVKSAASSDFPNDAIADSPEARASLRGSLVRTFIDAGKVITTANVLRPRDRGFIASVLEKGMRAATIGVDPVSGVAGLIWPGDHVDVLLTQEIANASPAHKAMSETVLTNVRVIAIDQEMVQGASGDTTVAGKLVRTVTLEVNPLQTQKLAVAAHMGKLSLSIRAAEDQQADTAPVTYGSDVSPALMQPAGATVTIVEGDKMKVVKFQ